MTLRVVSFATYLVSVDVLWRDGDYNALKFVKAIKGLPVNMYARVPVCGVIHRLEQANADEAIGWFGELGAAYILGKNLPQPVTFAPVPNSRCAITNNEIPRTLLLAQALAERVGNADVWDGLRWATAMVPSSQGGTRDPQALYDNLVLTKEMPARRLVLVDDVRTTGAHFVAALAKLVERGAECSLALCAARRVDAQEESPFSVREEEFPAFVPRRLD
jgi:predicted amidophosphoribosyltransferase